MRTVRFGPAAGPPQSHAVMCDIPGQHFPAFGDMTVTFNRNSRRQAFDEDCDRRPLAVTLLFPLHNSLQNLRGTCYVVRNKRCYVSLTTYHALLLKTYVIQIHRGTFGVVVLTEA